MFGAKIGAREGPARMLRNFLKDTSGATAIEYALIASLIALAIIAALNNVSTRLKFVFSEVATALK
jgi:pilus assembly protein Flp/PilA